MRRLIDKYTTAIFGIYLAIAISATHSTSAQAQDNGVIRHDALTASHLSVANGLTGNTIRAMVQDNQGFIWMGGTAGLTRYDGYSCVTFNDPTAATNNVGQLDYDSKNNLLWITLATYSIRCLDLNKWQFADYTARGDNGKCYRKHLAARNGMWLYTESYGIRHIEYKDGTFKTTDYNTANHRIPENHVSSIAEDGDGNIWAISSRHIIRIDGNGKAKIVKGGISPLNLRADGNDVVVVDTGNSLYHFSANGKLMRKSILPKALGDIKTVTTAMIWQNQYIAFTQGSTFSCDLKSGTWQRPGNMQLPGALWQGEAAGYSFVANTRDGTLWIFPDKGQLQKLKVINHISANPGRGRIFNVTMLNDSVMAIATYGAGLALYNPKNGNLTKYTAEDAMPLFHSNYLFHILKDRDNGLWLAADAAGVSHIKAKEPPIATFAIPNPDKHGSRDNGIKGLFRIKSGKIVASTFNDKNYTVDTDNATLTPYTAFEYGISAYTVDHNGNEWIGTTSNGLFAGNSNFTETKSKTGLTSNEIRDLACDRKGRIWVATWRGGLLWTHPESKGTFHQLLNDSYNKTRIQDLELAPSGWLYIATFDGLYAIDTNADSIRAESIVGYNTQNNTLPTNEVTVVMAADSNTVWIGTNGYGLIKFTINKGKIKTQSTTRLNGLPNDNVRSIRKDANGNIWAGTEEGLAMVDTKNMTARRYMPSATIMGNVFNTSSALSDGTGRLLFSTNEGVAVITPDTGNQTSDGQSKSPWLTDIIIDGKSIFTDASLFTAGNPFSDRAISLRHYQNHIVFCMSPLHYSSIDATLYQYRIEGVDDAWQTPTTSNCIECQNLSPGSYTLHYRTLTDGQWSKAETFKFTILQPWYNSVWAWIVYIAAIMTVATILYRQWRRNFELRQRMQVDKQVSDFRIQFFTNVAHEFRTPLAIIQGAVDDLTTGKNQPAVSLHRPTLQMIRRGTTRLLRLVNELMEFRKITTGNSRLRLTQCDIIAPIRDIYDDFRILAQQKEQSLTLTPFDKSFTLPLDRPKVETIVYNLLSNAVKYTPAKGTIHLGIRHANGHISVSVTDSGQGISERQQQSLFKPFLHGHTSQGGMGIGLYTAYQLARLHHGDLTYSHDGNGSTFTLTLPDCDGPYSAGEYDTTAAIESPKTTPHIADEVILEPAAQALNDATIAIIEDDADMQHQLRATLSAYFNVVAYSNGSEGYQGVTETMPSLVVCDVMLPDMDGYKIVEKLRQDPWLADMPVIMLTALDDVDHHIRGYKAGADDYLVKPCNRKLLITRVAQLITWARKRAAQTAQTSQGTGNVEQPGKIVTSQAEKNFRTDVDYYISSHIADPDFNVEILAAHMQMGHTKFYGKMKELTGMSPNKYIMAQRMRIAGELVAEGRLNISEIAYKTGFQDPSYFNKCFKKHFGTIPSKYGKAAE